MKTRERYQDNSENEKKNPHNMIPNDIKSFQKIKKNN